MCSKKAEKIKFWMLTSLPQFIAFKNVNRFYFKSATISFNIWNIYFTQKMRDTFNTIASYDDIMTL